MCISDYMQTTFFYLEIFPKKLADDQCFSTTKGSRPIYHIKLMLIQPFAWDWIGLKLDVISNLLCLIFCTHCVFTLNGRVTVWHASAVINGEMYKNTYYCDIVSDTIKLSDILVAF